MMAMDMDLMTNPITIQPRNRTPDSDTETPPPNLPTKRAHHHTHHHAPGVSYKECMKNHAASIGGHALDGCCEFMPGPTFNPSDPTSLKCAACGCHRNFHRRDPDDPAPLHHHLPKLTPARRAQSPPTASQLLLSLSQSPSGPSDEINPTGPTAGVLVGYTGGQNGNFTSGASSRKRFRTKFTQEQKEKMYEFSEKIGWKLKKGEERLVEEFVKEINVGRSVFKVWMHNNKHSSTSAKKVNSNSTDLTTSTALYVPPQQQQHSTSTSTSNGINKSGVTNNNNINVGNCGASVVADHHHHHNHHHQFNFANGGGQEAAQAQ